MGRQGASPVGFTTIPHQPDQVASLVSFLLPVCLETELRGGAVPPPLPCSLWGVGLLGLLPSLREGEHLCCLGGSVGGLLATTPSLTPGGGGVPVGVPMLPAFCEHGGFFRPWLPCSGGGGEDFSSGSRR